MKTIKTDIDGALIIEPDVFGDNRGWFFESYSKRKFEQMGIDFDFVQDNRSFSTKKGVIRGLHCQKNPSCQTKLITCISGAIYDVIVDIRKGSPTYMKWVKVELTGDNKRFFLVPKGCLHGFVTLTDGVEIMYKVDKFYSPADDRSVRFDDPVFGIDWEIDNPILSEKDMNAPLLKDSDVDFEY